jgi:hypothetical protein
MRTRLNKIACTLAALMLLSSPLATAHAQTPCALAGTNQTCTNSTTLSGGAIGLIDTATLTLTNTASGTITGTIRSINAVTANVTNSGIIQSTDLSSSGIVATDINLTNSGTIRGGEKAIFGNSWPTSKVNVVNSGAITAHGYGIWSDGDLNLTNSGTIQTAAGAAVISFNAANISNSGTIVNTGGSFGNGAGVWFETGSLTNSGTIRAVDAIAVMTTSGVNIVNSGLIEASGINASAIITTDGNIKNSGIIRASQNGIATFGTINLTNSGTIAGGYAALYFGNGFVSPTSGVLTLLRGSHIVGAILTNGGSTTVNFRTGNQNLNFDTLAGATITSTTPYAVRGNQAATVDVTAFAANWRSLTDFTRGVSDAVPVFAGGNAPLAFAGPDAPSRVEDAFAAIPGLVSAYAGEAAVFKAPTLSYADGATVWARGFAGQRIQQQDGLVLRTANQFYGGMLGTDFAARPDLHTGLFLGGGKTRTSIYFNQGGTDTDLLFGGAYARYDIGTSFLHGAVQGGGSRNASMRTVNNNLAANGIENAAASFNGWYVSPELTLGHRLALGRLADATYTLTPSVRVRYLYGAFDGYTETGTTAPLTIGSQSVSTMEERGELKLTRSVTLNPQNQLSTSLTGGVLGTQRLGSPTINAALLGQAIPFATPGKTDAWGGFGGLGLEWRRRNVSFFSAGEYLALSDKSNVISGRAGLRVAF